MSLWITFQKTIAGLHMTKMKFEYYFKRKAATKT